MTGAIQELDRATYIGRFAPSPSGPLHFGSLVCALASYLDAKAHNGIWRLRIDDIDPPREQPGATEQIINSLKAHDLIWDGEIFFQSQQNVRYKQTLDKISQLGLSYKCNCTRKRLSALNFTYDGHCKINRLKANEPAATRIDLSACAKYKSSLSQSVSFVDAIQGHQNEDITRDGDFIIHRKDQYFAYQLAVVADDIYQGISHVVRGIDLLPTTAKQIYFMELLDGTRPCYAHIPVVANLHGDKLSKQNHAPPINNEKTSKNLYEACLALNLAPTESLEYSDTKTILEWATGAWNYKNLQHKTTYFDGRFS